MTTKNKKKPVVEAEVLTAPRVPVPINGGDTSKVTMEGENLSETAQVIDLIIKLHNDVTSSVKVYKAAVTQAVKSAIQCGQLLIVEKENRKKTFSAWCMVYLPFTHQTANNYMRLAKNIKLDAVDENTSLRQAYILCGVIKPKKTKTTTTGANNNAGTTETTGTQTETGMTETYPAAENQHPETKEIMVYVWLKNIMAELPKYDTKTIDELLPVMGESIIKWYDLEKAKRKSVDLNKGKTRLPVVEQELAA